MSADDATTIETRTATTTTVETAPDDAPIARPAHWVASLLWVILVLTCALVALGSAAALILDFLAPAGAASGTKEVVLLLFSTSFNGLIALFVSRPGTR
jgi:hypothetical protein